LTYDRGMRFALLFAIGCGGGAPPNGVDAPMADGTAQLDAPASGAFAVASPMLAPGAMFAAANTCTGPGNTSPQLVWTGDAKGALGFAVTLTDLDIGLVHWAIYDIPANATGLPADVMKVYAPTNVAGAHQTDSYTAGMRGYLGPCPPMKHNYRFDVYGLDVATVAGTSMATTRAQVVPSIMQHMVVTASLTGNYTQP
jgi:Raf kinase inhibitor-like YbhB/YbcL family protein